MHAEYCKKLVLRTLTISPARTNIVSLTDLSNRLLKSAGAGQITGIISPSEQNSITTDQIVVSAFLWALVLVSLVELVAAFALVGSLRPFRRPGWESFVHHPSVLQLQYSVNRIYGPLFCPSKIDKRLTI